jgi:hypothetical protein
MIHGIEYLFICPSPGDRVDYSSVLSGSLGRVCLDYQLNGKSGLNQLSVNHLIHQACRLLADSYAPGIIESKQVRSLVNQEGARITEHSGQWISHR